MASTNQIICKNCGGVIDLVPNVFEYVCPYCETKNSIINPNATEEKLPTIPEKMILVRASQKEFHNFVLTKMAEDMNSPDDLVEKSEINDETLLYVPCYFSSGSIKANWSASFGYDRQEPYTAYVTYTDNRGRQQTRPVTRYKTVTDWRPASGQTSGKFLTQAYAGEPIPPIVESSLNTLKGDLVSYNPNLLTGCEVKPFAKALEDVRPALDKQIGLRTQEIVYSNAQGDHQRNWSYDQEVTVDFEKPGLLPLGKATFTYKNKQYRLFSDAANLVLYYKDKFPVDHRRQNKVSRAFVPFYITLFYAAIAALLVYQHIEYINFIAVLIGLGLPLLFGILRKIAVTSFSKKMRASALAQKDLNDNAQLKSQEEIQKLYHLSKKPSLPLFARDGADKILLPFLTIIYLIVCITGIFWPLID